MTEIEAIAIYSRIREAYRKINNDRTTWNSERLVKRLGKYRYESDEELQEDAVELALSAIGIFIRAGGNVQSLQEIVQQRLNFWEANSRSLLS